MSRETISHLAKQRPQYLEDAKQRAKRLSKETQIECPFCENGTFLGILHVFPPTDANAHEALSDANWHLRCGKCNHDGYFTVKFEEDDPRGKDLREEFKRIQRKRDNR